MRIVWDAVGDRLYSDGVSQGVLYPADVSGVSWNGLISVTRTGDQNQETRYLDGQKYYSKIRFQASSGIISAYTYPVELEPYIGINGIRTGQARQSFGFTYRTNNEIHIVYNVFALPSKRDYSSDGDSFSPAVFEWAFTTQPEKIPGGRPSSHFVIMVEDSHPTSVKNLETILYGDDITDPRLPAPEEIIEIFEANTTLRITDNGDGTWTASGPDDVVSVLASSQFKIVWPSLIFSENYTAFTISSGWDGSISAVPAFAGAISQKKKYITAAGSSFSAATGSIKRKKMLVAGTGSVIAAGISDATGAVKQKKMRVSVSGAGISVAVSAVKQKKMLVAGTGSVIAAGTSDATGAFKQKKMRVAATSQAGTINNFITAYAGIGSTTRNVTVTAATQAGDTLLVSCTTNSATSSATALTDSKGNIYTLDRSHVSSSPSQVVFRSPGATGGPAGAPTVALTTSDTLTITMVATGGSLGVLGVALPNTLIGAYDVIPASVGNGNNTTPTATATPTYDRDIAIGLFSSNSSGGLPTVNSPFSTLVNAEVSTFHYHSATYQILPAGTSGAAQTSTETIVSGVWKGILYLFQSA